MASYEETASDSVEADQSIGTYVDNEFPQEENLLYRWSFDNETDGLLEQVAGSYQGSLKNGAVVLQDNMAEGSGAIYIGEPPSEATEYTSLLASSNPLAGPLVYGGNNFSELPVAGRFNLSFSIWAYRQDWSIVGANTNKVEGIVSLNANFTSSGVVAASADGGVGLAFVNKAAIFSVVRQGIVVKSVATSIASLSAGWHHIVCVYREGQYLEIYIDGVLENTTDSGSVAELDYANDGTTLVVFGVCGLAEGGYVSGKTNFIGALDAPCVWASALSPPEIHGLYDSQWLSMTITQGLYATDSTRPGTDYIHVLTEALYVYGVSSAAYGKVVAEQLESISSYVVEHGGTSTSSYYENIRDSTEADALLSSSMTLASEILEEILSSSGATLLTKKTMAVLEELQADSSISLNVSAVIAEVIALLAEESAAGSTFNTSVLQGLSLSGRLLLAWAAIVSVEVKIQSGISEEVFRLLSLLEKVQTTDSLSQSAIAVASASAIVAILEEFSAGKGALSEDEVEIDQTLADSLMAFLVVVDRVIASTVQEMTAVFSVSPLERVNVSPELDSTAVFKTLIADGITFSVNFGLGGQVYSAYVMNTKNFALSEYQNFPFNSFAKVGTQYYAASETGLYLLDGSTDAGEDVQATITLGAMDFTGERKTNVCEAFLALRNDGEIAIKVKTDDNIERWYRMSQESDVLRDRREKFARGVTSRFWTFSLENIDGADFEVHEMTFLPLVMKRRI